MQYSMELRDCENPSTVSIFWSAVLNWEAHAKLSPRAEAMHLYENREKFIRDRFIRPPERGLLYDIYLHLVEITLFIAIPVRLKQPMASRGL